MCVCVSINFTKSLFKFLGLATGTGALYTLLTWIGREAQCVCVCVSVCGCLTLWRSWPGCRRSYSWPQRRPPCRAKSSFHPSSQPSYPRRELLNCSCPTTSWPAWEDTGGVSLKLLQEHEGRGIRSSSDTSNRQFKTAFFSVSHLIHWCQSQCIVWSLFGTYMPRSCHSLPPPGKSKPAGGQYEDRAPGMLSEQQLQWLQRLRCCCKHIYSGRCSILWQKQRRAGSTISTALLYVAESSPLLHSCSNHWYY